MKFILPNQKNKPLLLLALLFFCNTLNAQQTLVNIGGWNAYVHVPWDYTANPTKTYPTILFFPGLGEVGTDPSLVIANGPGAYIQQGWNGNVKVGTDSVKFIVISLQPPSAYPVESTVNSRIQTLKGMYRIDNARLNLTGLSMGGWCSTTFVTGDPLGGPYTYASQVATVVEVEGVKPDDNQPYPTLFDNFAKSNGRLLGFEQINDSRDIQTRVNEMNNTKANSGIFVSTNYSGGGHCCWEQFYGGSGVTPNNFTLDGISQNIYQWIARNKLPASNQPPVANAGTDKTITLPTNTTTLNGSGTDADGTISGYAWTKLSGPSSGTIASPTAATTALNNLVQGTYSFQLTVTDNSGATATDIVQVTVNPAPNQPPVANAGIDKTITLPINTTTLNGGGTDADGTIAGYSWTKLSGPSAGTITSPTAATTALNNLVEGTYSFQLTVTDNSGATATDVVQVTVNPAPNQPPVANAGTDKAITLPTNTTTLNGSGTDPDGTIAGYAWIKLSGPSAGTIASPTAATTALNNLVQGTYSFQLTVTDNSGATATDVIQVTVNPAPNQPPVANAGTDKTIILPTNTTTLNGSGTDADGTISSYAWTKLSGPSAGTIASPTAATTALNNLVQGTYSFQLTITDNDGATAIDVVQVTVNPAPNQPPIANAGTDKTITLPTNTTTLNGSGTDADGTITGYAWTKLSGPSAGTIASPTAATTALNNLVQGTYSFQLTVTDNDGATATDVVKVTVNPAPNQPPVANAGTDKTITLPTNTTTLNGSGIDADGTISGYAWTKLSGPSAGIIASPTAATTALNNLVQGTYSFQLTVTDNSGATAADVVQVTVNPAPNQPPVANAGTDKAITLPTNTTTLNGSGTDPDGTIAGYAWTKLSGPSAGTIASPTAATTALNNLVQGTYSFQLTVTDNDGATATDVVQVTVNPAPNQPPVANAGTDKTMTLPTNTTTLNGSGTDVDGTIAGYAWTKLSGPSAGTIAFPTAATTALNNLVQGTYSFQLTVTDNSGATAVDVVQVTVNPAPNQPPIANAGIDKTITLPINTTTLNGSGTDADGTISGYAWTKLSGPSAGTIASPTAAITALNNLVEGTYSFQLTVTDNSRATAIDVVQVTVNPAPNQPPVANAGTDKTITLPTNTTTLNGSGTDPDGTIAGYSWTKLSGPSAGTIASPTAATTALNNLVQGTYSFQLTVTDNDGAIAADVIQVTVNPAPNQPPVANAGTDKTITLPINTTTLNGSGTDADGTISGYAWTKLSGPSAGTIASPTATTTALNNLVQGTYSFQLTVVDNSGATATDVVQVTVNPAPNQPPVANAGTDKTITLPINTTTLNGSGTDADGTIAGYSWTKLSGPSAGTIASPTAATTALNNLVQGTYSFQLTVTDNDGAIAADVIQVTVNPASNQPPVANAGTDKTITLPTNTTTLNGSGTDADGTISGYAWTKLSGPSSGTIASPTAATTALNNLVQGTYSFQLTVTDNSGATATDVVQVTVNPAPNQPPVANAGTDKTITLPTNTTTLNGSGTDPDGTIAGYSWIKLSGPSAGTIASPTAATTALNNLVQGIYSFQLTVTDNDGATATDVVQVTVNPAPNQPPVANAGTDKTITLPTNTTTLNGSGTDADGTITGYAWTKLSGPSASTITSPTAATTALNNLVEGTYSFQLTVTDNSGATAIDVVQVTVNPAPNQPPVANAGTDKTITLPINTTTLNGSGTDADGTITGYSWTKLSGPSAGTIASPTAATTALNNLVEGTYNFQLTVTDNDGGMSTDLVQVTVNPLINQPPVANAGPDKAITLPVSSVTFSGSGTDADGMIVSYEWEQVSGPTSAVIANSASPSTDVSNLEQGVYNFNLTVTDDDGASATDAVQVIVSVASKIPPVANAGNDISIILPTDSATLYGSSTHPDGTLRTYSWKKISGPASYVIVTPDEPTTVVKNLVKGLYKFEFTVTNESGLFGKDTMQLSVNSGPNQSPTANAGSDIVIKLPANNAQLKGSGQDNDGKIVSYHWRKISGPRGFLLNKNSPQASVFNLTKGIYMFELTVTDDSGAIAKDTMQLTVNAANLIADSSANNYLRPDISAVNLISVERVGLLNNTLGISISSEISQKINIDVIDVSGVVFLSVPVDLHPGMNTFSKFIPGLYQGVFYVRIINNNGSKVKGIFNGH